MPSAGADAVPSAADQDAPRLLYPPGRDVPLSAARVGELCGRLREAAPGVAHMPVAGIAAAIGRTVRSLADEAGDPASPTVEALAAATGYSVPMIGWALRDIGAAFDGPALDRLLRRELRDPACLDGFAPRPEGGAEHARGPGLTFVSLAGNVLHVAVEAVVVALLTKSACFLKAASRDRVFPAVLAGALGRADRRLGAALAVAWWPGGDTEFEAAATAAAGAVIAYGSAAAVESLRARVPAGARFVAHGPKVSLAVVEAGSCTWDTARALALDISVYDQQGCVAPHTVYVVSDSGAAARFAGLLAGAMATVQAELPAGRLGAADAVAIQQARGAAEFAPGAAVHAPNGGAEWTVVFEPAPDFRGSCLNRVVYVKPLSDLGALPGAVHSVDGLVQTVGVAGGAEFVAAGARIAAVVGASRVCPIGRMNQPPAAWRHDGRPRLLDLLTWTDLEAGVARG